MLGISEIVRNAMRLPGPILPVQYLQKHQSIPLVKLLQLAFDARPRWLLPRDVFIPYRPAPTNANIEGMLYSNARLLYIFLEGQNAPVMDQLRREIKFVQFLESLDGEDAKFVISVKDQRLEKDYGLTLEIVQEAFPGLIEVPIAPRPQKASVPSVAAPEDYKKKTEDPYNISFSQYIPPHVKGKEPAPKKIKPPAEKKPSVPKEPKEKRPAHPNSLANLAKGREVSIQRSALKRETETLIQDLARVTNEQKL
jgi:hypothetical protein